MNWFTVLYSDAEEDNDVIPVMVQLSQDHINIIQKGQEASRQLEEVVNIILRLNGTKLSKPKMTFLEEGYENDLWAEYESIFAKIDGNGKVAISVSYIESHGYIEQRFVYSSAYDSFDSTTEYLIGDDLLYDYLQDADNLSEIKKFIIKKDYEFLVKRRKRTE